MNTRLTVFLLMTALILASLNDLFADVINVPDDFETIQAAVNNTGEGDTVLVEPGEYNEQVRLPGRNIVLTSFRLIEDDEDFIARTIINAANFNGSAVRMAEGTNERTVLDGFSIINGRTDYGGGVYIAEAGPTLRFLNVANNTATQVGGGIYATRNSTANISHSTIINNNGFIGGGIVIVNGAQITITDCLIQGNSTDEHGGGVHCTSQSEVSLLDVIVRENTSTLLGAGVHVNRGSTMNLNRVQIIDNRGDTGGGIALRAGSEFNAIDVDVIGNFSNGPGGGIYSEESFSTMTNCNFLGNSCPNQGGGQFFMGGTSVQTRCVIADNECSRVAAVYNLWADLSYRNCTIANNRGEEISEIHSVQGEINLLNSIIWNENNSIITTSNNDEETVSVSYCDITGGRDGLVVDEQDNISWGEGNIDEDPLFADIDELDYHLTEDSPCIDVGDPDAEPDPDDTRRDMGAYYFHQENNNPELQHFVDVQETDVSHLILVEEVQFDDEPVADGWEIGVFTRDDVLSGAVVWGDGGAELIAYGDNQETEDVEGFYPDEYLLSFRAWNPETDMVHRFGFDVDVGGWEWNNEDETTVSLWSNPEIVEQRIELNEHWNMISLNIRPSRQFYVRFGNDEFPDVVCMTLQFWDGPERHHHILLKNGLGHFYVPAWGFHQIPGWMPDEGYQILMDTDMTGTWWGTQIAPEEEIALREGWGIYAYYPGYELDASAPDFYVLSNIIENVELAKDEDGSFIATEFNFSNMPPWRAGEGYQIKTTQECVLVYPEQRDEELNASENTLIRHWHQPAPTGNNMSILVDLKDVVSQNSEIAAFTESGQLVGCGVVNENGQCGLAVWGDDTATDEVDGLLDGEAFVLMCWEDRTRQETDLRVTDIINGEGLNFGIDGFTTLTCSPISGLPTDMEILSISPNPFNSSTSINYSIPAMDRIKISIFDINGRLIETLVNETLSAGIYNVVWDASMVSAGVYLLSIKDSAGKPSRIRKLVMIR